MIGVKIQVVDDTKRVKDAAEKAAYRSLQHAAASIRKAAQESIVMSREPSPPGSPPHTRRGLLRRSIFYSATKESAVIGPAFSRIGTGAEPHEHGGRVRGRKEKFPQRPLMGPALVKNLGRFASSWRGAVAKQ